MDYSLPKMNKETKNKITCFFKLLLFLFIACIPFCSKAQILVSGKVIDSRTELPLARVEINDLSYNTLTLSNPKGTFFLEFTDRKEVSLVLYKEGYEQEIVTLDLSGKTDGFVFQLNQFSEQINEITIKTDKENDFGISRLRTIDGFGIYAGRKSEVIEVRDLPANLATNNSRQVFAKVPGFNIWESDCAGLQLGVGGRGLSPNRSTNFNMRQNGYDISADPMGYPESYYAPPMQAIERIEVVRGAASLQYGSQFGGLVNFELKKGNPNKKFEANTSQTLGSYWYFNSFNSVGGQLVKLNYYAYYQYRRGNCWRCNSSFNMHAAYKRLAYQFNEKVSISAEHTFLTYLAQQAGGLTDAFFQQDPQQSIRENNWFQIKWNLSAVNFDWKINSKTKLNNRTSFLKAARNAVGNLGRIDRTEDINANRNLLIDKFLYGVNETRLIHRYKLNENFSNLLIGARIYFGKLNQEQGLALSGTKEDFNFINEEPYYLSYTFPSKNSALFAENVFQLSDKFSITPGFRVEWLSSEADGFYFEHLSDLSGNVYNSIRNEETKKNNRFILLSGITASYKPNEDLEIYGGIAQNYRPIGFNDIRVANTNIIVDSLIQDEKGFNIDLGLRGDLFDGAVNLDFTAFHLKYGNKIGNVLITVPDTILPEPTPIIIERSARFRTNVSVANIFGFEGFAEVDFLKLFRANNMHGLYYYFNIALIKGKYKSDNSAFDGKEVEYIPPVNLKTGLTYRYKNSVKLGWQLTFVSRHYSDATNAPFSPSAVEGIIPSYFVNDLYASYRWKLLTVELSVNNLTNEKYFTRRASGYPGPGIIPAEGISAFLTTSISF